MAVGVPVNFDGTNDRLHRGAGNQLTGMADGKIVLFSTWLRILGGGGTLRRLLVFTSTLGTTRFSIHCASGDEFNVTGFNSTPTQILSAVATGTPTDTDWHHLLVSIDMASTSNRAVFLDGTAMSMTWSTYTDDTIDWVPTSPNCGVGATPSNVARWNGDLAELYFHTPASYFDPTNPTNLAKFISGGAPVDLGATGDNPLGLQPLLCLNAGTTAGWNTNAGSGGGMTLVGTLSDGAVSLPVRESVPLPFMSRSMMTALVR